MTAAKGSSGKAAAKGKPAKAAAKPVKAAAGKPSAAISERIVNASFFAASLSSNS